MTAASSPRNSLKGSLVTQLKKDEMPQTDPHNTFSHRLNPYVLAAVDLGILQEVYRDSYHSLVAEPRAGTQAQGQHAPASIFKMLYGTDRDSPRSIKECRVQGIGKEIHLWASV